MQSSYYLAKKICTLSIDPADLTLESFGADVLGVIQKNKVSHVIIDMNNLEIITSQTIDFVEKLAKILKLNSIETIVCGFSVESASIIFHFVDNVNFKTALNVESALDAIKYKQ